MRDQNDEFALSIFFLESNCPLMLPLNATYVRWQLKK